MTHSTTTRFSRSWGVGLVAGLVALTFTGTVSSDETSTLSFRVRAIDNDRDGDVLCALYDSEERWLGEEPFRHDEVKVTGKVITCTFHEVPKGTYGAACLHDEDGDKHMDTTLLGLPHEGYCISRNAQNESLTKPNWDDAAFRHDGGGHREVSDMDY